jgi:hypothetical protein
MSAHRDNNEKDNKSLDSIATYRFSPDDYDFVCLSCHEDTTSYSGLCRKCHHSYKVASRRGSASASRVLKRAGRLQASMKRKADRERCRDKKDHDLRAFLTETKAFRCAQAEIFDSDDDLDDDARGCLGLPPKEAQAEKPHVINTQSSEESALQAERETLESIRANLVSYHQRLQQYEAHLRRAPAQQSDEDVSMDDAHERVNDDSDHDAVESMLVDFTKNIDLD